jgi:hypothetical protein
MGVEGDCSGNTMYSCMKMEKWDIVKLFQEWGKRGIKENDGGCEFKCSPSTTI